MSTDSSTTRTPSGVVGSAAADQPIAPSRRSSGASTGGRSTPGTGLPRDRLLPGTALLDARRAPVAQHRVILDPRDLVLERCHRLAQGLLRVRAVLPGRVGAVVAHDAHALVLSLERSQLVRDVALFADTEHARPVRELAGWLRELRVEIQD